MGSLGVGEYDDYGGWDGGEDEMVWGMGWVGEGIGGGRMEWWGNGMVEGNGMVGE